MASGPERSCAGLIFFCAPDGKSVMGSSGTGRITTVDALPSKQGDQFSSVGRRQIKQGNDQLTIDGERVSDRGLGGQLPIRINCVAMQCKALHSHGTLRTYEKRLGLSCCAMQKKMAQDVLVFGKAKDTAQSGSFGRRKMQGCSPTSLSKTLVVMVRERRGGADTALLRSPLHAQTWKTCLEKMRRLDLRDQRKRIGSGPANPTEASVLQPDGLLNRSQFAFDHGNERKEL